MVETGSELRLKIDAIDRRILALLQEDATLTQAELARRAALSQTSCWRRLQKLQEAGVIAGQVVLVDPHAVGLGVNVVANVSLREHTDGNREAFEEFLRTRPEVVEAYSMTGERDYLLRVVVEDVEAYEHFLTTYLLHHPAVSSASSSFALKQIKFTTALPLDAEV